MKVPFIRLSVPNSAKQFTVFQTDPKADLICTEMWLYWESVNVVSNYILL